jgi:epoxyqueuosine reductase
MVSLNAAAVKRAALECGFELAGIACAAPPNDAARYQQWVRRGHAGAMGYLADYRADRRNDPRSLMPSARSILCVGKLYNAPHPYSTAYSDNELGWISRYAWGEDYHDVLREGLTSVAARLGVSEYKICVDTAPILERSFARLAGLGWIGKNTCLINQWQGSWFFLGEMLLPFDQEPDSPPADRCGTCTRCIDACPTQAIVAPFELDARLCISYFTIELRGVVPEESRAGIGNHVFGCDICQDVCPWNRKAATTEDPAFAPVAMNPPLEKLASLSKQEFDEMFRSSPVKRSRHAGFLRNVAVAMGNSGSARFRLPLERMAQSDDAMVAAHASWALAQL